MKIAIIGATGATGRLVVDQAIARGYEVVAYTRNPEALTKRSGLSIVTGQLDNQKSLQTALKGVDAVLCCLGTRSFFGIDIMQRNLPLVSKAMQVAGVSRLVLISAYGVGDTARSASLLARILYKTIVSSVYKDKEISEKALAQTSLKVTGIYPVILTDGPLIDAVDVRPTTAVHRVVGMPKVSRANVAKAMLDALENDQTIGQRLVISSRNSLK